MSATLTAPPAPDETEEATGSGKKKLVIVLVLLLVLGGAGYWFFLKPSAPKEPEPGEVVTLEPIQVNLADGHYLRLGFDLQLTEEVGEEAPDTGKAVDAAIALFSGRSVSEVSDPEKREELKEKLLHQVEELYEGEVMDLYLTNYVTQ